MGGQLTRAALLRDAEDKRDVRLGPRHVSQRMGKSDASCPETLRSCLPAAWAGIVQVDLEVSGRSRCRVAMRGLKSP